MSDYPIDPIHFAGARRITPKDRSEGGAPLASLLNAAAQSAESETVKSGGSTDLSAADVDTVKAASRGVTTNLGTGTFTFTLPDFAAAPDGWEHTFIALDGAANNLVVVHAGTDTINGIAGDVDMTTANHEWTKIFKVPGATGWLGIGGTMVTPA